MKTLITLLTFLVCTVSVFGQPSASNAKTSVLNDKRDGKTYKTATIASQTWMIENLAFKTSDY